MSNNAASPPAPQKTANFHYFRIARETWELMLVRLAQLGLEAITVPVPWNFHQLSPTATDLNGATNARRNLVDLVKLCRQLKLHCILHIGPFCRNQAVLGDGLPDWVVPATDTFTAAVQQWISTLGQTLADAQWPAGAIVALQIDRGEPDDDALTYPTHLSDVQWPIWLRKQYQGIDALNAAYGASYRSVSDVPLLPSAGDLPAPLQKDVEAFLAEHVEELETGYSRMLSQAGWRVPVYEACSPAAPLPTDETVWVADADVPFLTLPAPIQVEPDPPDIATAPVWAATAPIQANGWLRKQFWLLRHTLWTEQWPDSLNDGPLWSVSFAGGGIVSAAQDMALKLPVAKGSKPAIYRLYVTGAVRSDDDLRISRNQLRGEYIMEDEAGQTDFVFYLDDPAAPLSPFLADIFSRLLLAQAIALQECAELAGDIGQTLAIRPAASVEPAKPAAKAARGSTPYTIAEARRGLHEAEAVLKKAMSSIGGLESGFGTILDKRAKTAEPAAEPLKISPEIFEGAARELLTAAGERCTQLAPALQGAAETIMAAVVVDAIPALTLDQYQYNYTVAMTVARSTAQPLIEIIAQLRQEIATEQLPLVTWQVHNQIQAIVDGLRWGVARGGDWQ